MTRIYSHTIQDAPGASRFLLEGLVQFSPTGKLLRDGRALGDDKTDALVDVAREAAARSGQVSDVTWQRAADCGWSSEHLTEAFAFVALTVVTAYFLNFARTPMDLPAAPGERG